ncbi:MAG: helix-turn-helix-domain containing protein AraC type [Sporomusa sp.]|jgi:AraC-like DNA-binding protein|nr:helix-turn-helix-domain containing protein AraC type [Sporomusa sp.]
MINMRNSFKLYQPLVMRAANYQEFIPQGEFSNSIALFYQFQMPSSHHQLIAVPDGVVDVVFRCDSSKPYAKVIGSVLAGRPLVFTGGYEHFGVRFFPGQAGVFTGELGESFIDQEVSLADVMHRGGEFVEQVVSRPGFYERVQMFLSGRFSMQEKRREMPEWGKYLMQRVNEQLGGLSIKDMALETGYSPQHITRTFKSYLGVSPKYFCRVVRFQNAIELIHKQPFQPVDDIIFGLGYFDQAHFIKEFKEFCMLTPWQFVQRNFGKAAN